MGEDQSQTSRQRVTVAQGSEILGVTVEAVRGRIKRGTLEHERHSSTVYVLLHADQMTTGRRPDADRLQSDSTALISAKDETITTLREQLAAERQAHAEARRIIAELVERIPAIEAPTAETPEAYDEAAEEAAEASGRVESQEGVQRPWWKKCIQRIGEKHAERSDCKGRDEVTKGVQYQPCGS